MYNYIDYEQSMLGAYNSVQPVNIKGQSNIETKYHKRYLYNKIYSCLDFDFDGLEWDLNTFRFALIHFGSVCFYNHKSLGWIFGRWSPKEKNIYNNPMSWNFNVFNSSALKGEPTKVGTKDNSVIVKMFDDYLGFDDLVSSTAVQLALLDRVIETASMNANVNLVAFTKTKKQGEEIRTAYSQATKGEPLVIMNNSIKDKVAEGHNILEPFTNHDTALSMDRLLTSRRTILNNFLTEVGIKNANFQKKERLITDEVNSNNEEVSCNITIAYDNIKKGFDRFNELSGKNIKVDLNYDYITQNDLTVVEGGEE